MRDENQCLHGRDAHAPLAFASHTLSLHFRISQAGEIGGMPGSGQAERKAGRQSGKGRKVGDFHNTLAIGASVARYGFFAKGVLAFQHVGVKIGTLWLEAASLAHRAAVRSEGVK